RIDLPLVLVVAQSDLRGERLRPIQLRLGKIVLEVLAQFIQFPAVSYRIESRVVFWGMVFGANIENLFDGDRKFRDKGAFFRLSGHGLAGVRDFYVQESFAFGNANLVLRDFD